MRDARIHTSMFLGIFIFVLVSCGIDEYVYLEPIPAGNIRTTLSESTTITLPDSSIRSSFFKNYTIYYKIYLSNTSIPGTVSEGDLLSINSTLSSDYLYIKPYTNVTSNDSTISPSNVESRFRGRNYNTIAVEGINIETLLNNTADNKILSLNFSPTRENDIYNANPILTIDDNSYILNRSLDSGNSELLEPDRRFKNTPEIHISNDANQDVAWNGTTTECYVSLYIVKVGMDPSFSLIYSFPTFIGIFRLPS